MQYTEDFKRGIVRTLLASGMTRKEFAAKTKITVQALRKWVKQYKDEEIKMQIITIAANTAKNTKKYRIENAV